MMFDGLPQKPLQQGRAQLSAERALRAEKEVATIRASTGPRSIERGEP